MGEEAVDAGGVRKEFFLLIMKELLDPKYGMFRYYEESRLIWFSNKVLGYCFFFLRHRLKSSQKRKGRSSMTLLATKCLVTVFDLSLQTFEDFDLFHLIGLICGLAIYNLTIVELHFPVALYKKLLKREATLDDLKELMPDVGRSDQKNNQLFIK